MPSNTANFLAAVQTWVVSSDSVLVSFAFTLSGGDKIGANQTSSHTLYLLDMHIPAGERSPILRVNLYLMSCLLATRMVF
jgi:hypothetical protein